MIEQATHITLITDVISRLAQAADFGTLEEYGALLSDDVVWEYPGAAAIAVPAQVRRGRTDVMTGARERRDIGVQGPGTGTLHVVTNVSVLPDGREAQSMAYWRFYAGVGEAPVLRSMGVYRDRFVRENQDWLLAHRRIGFG